MAGLLIQSSYAPFSSELLVTGACQPCQMIVSNISGMLNLSWSKLVTRSQLGRLITLAAVRTQPREGALCLVLALPHHSSNIVKHLVTTIPPPANQSHKRLSNIIFSTAPVTNTPLIVDF